VSSGQERAAYVGYATFAILFAVLDIGYVIVRVAGLIALSGSPALATILVLVSMSASVTLPLLAYPARLLNRRKRESGGELAMESGTVADGARK
jgi:L-cystine uptake protein TcyP (sodium:dicarboxylate symporter family)